MPRFWYIFLSSTLFSNTVIHSIDLAKGESLAVDEDALFLTPYIEKGQIKKAQKLAVVHPMLKNVESFSGFLTVNKTRGSNIFFWLFKSQEGDWEERPLVTWVDGGPGVSALFGLFYQVGPYAMAKSQTIIRRKYSWNRALNLLFIDSPVGSGFSFTETEAGYSRTDTDAVNDLYQFFTQFYQLFPALQKNDLFIGGGSYGGKIVSGIGYEIYAKNKVSSTFKMPLAGLIIQNGWIDPINQLGHAAFLYHVGLIDGKTKEIMKKREDQIRTDIKAGENLDAHEKYFQQRKFVEETTGLKCDLNFVRDDIYNRDAIKLDLTNVLTKLRKSLHMSNHVYRFYNEKVHERMKEAFVLSARPWVEELLAEELPILFYYGQLDSTIPYASSVNFIDKLKWPRARDYHEAKRCQFTVKSDVVGYYKTAGSFSEVLVRNAGHTAPTEQPKWVHSLLHTFIFNRTALKCV